MNTASTESDQVTTPVTDTVTTPVDAAPIIEAEPDVVAGIDSATGGMNVINVLDDDLLNGQPINPGQVTVVFSPDGTIPAGITFNADGSIKSSVGKFYEEATLKAWGEKAGAEAGDMLLILSGETDKTRKQLSELRLELGKRLDLIKAGDFKPLWVVDFPLLEWDEESERFHAMHHPFTSPKKEEIPNMLNGDHQTMKNLKADAYDLVINGSEIGGGSIRIHDRELQSKNFELLGFTPEEAEAQFGFLLGAFEYGAPPHGGIAFGFDRLCAVLNGSASIRDFIAFPKNNQGRDMMIDAPSVISAEQLEELSIGVVMPEEA